MSVGTQKVRLKDVAERAGVSVATASVAARSLSDSSIRMSEDTRRRVVSAIDELDYRPNAVARALRAQRTGMVAIVVPDITNSIFPKLIRAVQVEAELHDLNLMVWDSHNDAVRERNAVDALLQWRVDGVVLATNHLTRSDLKPLLRAGVAVSTTDPGLTGPSVDVVSEDTFATAAAAVRHLISYGHQQIGHLAGDVTTKIAQIRLEACRVTMADAGLAIADALVVPGSFERESGARGMNRLLRLEAPPTAVFAANDMIAVGALQECHRQGVRCPDDLSIIGIDNAPESAAVSPGLTTMDPQPHVVAAGLVQAIARRSRKEPISGSLQQSRVSQLIERNSVAPPPKSSTSRSNP